MTVRVLAWSLALLGVGIAVAMTVLDAANGHRQSPPIVGNVVGLAFLVIGALVASRRPRNPIGWLYLGCMLLTEFGGVSLFADQYALYALVTRPGSLPLAEWVVWAAAPALQSGFFGLLVLPLLLFPDGRLPSRRWRPIAIAAGIFIAAQAIVPGFTPGPLRSPVELANPLGVRALAEGPGVFAPIIGLLGLTSFVAGLAAPVVRFRRAAGPERAQLKWFAYGVAWIPAVALTGLLLNLAVPAVFGMVSANLYPLSVVGLPIATAIAILRYRLYDIDILINRTLVYGATTAAIAVAFFGGIVVLQTLLRPFTTGSEIAVAASTLFTIALFQPLRSRVQQAVDRRFFRSRYDAARTLDAFSARLANEVDLVAVRASLIDAVAGTVQPAHASLWLRDRAP